ncbi:MAG: DUF2142 domain-containing protein [Chloroflexi bacterium]|nr:DUF2142 domain-containing protein [Chloroflexota bacterium]
MSSGILSRKQGLEELVLPALVVLAFLHGLLYLSLEPPWQHYDEPTHFEYAWLIANRLQLPQLEDFDQGMRREVATSMLAHNFFRDSGFRPDLISSKEPIWIGFSELRHPPFYYLLLALPLRFLRYTSVTFQLYAGRLVSVILYASTIWVAGRLVAELTRERDPLRWAVPSFMVLLPAYSDLMTAVNNDVGAIAFFSLFLWGSVRMIMRGPSLRRIIWVVGSAAICAATKNTAGWAVPLLPLVFALSLLRRPWPWPGYAILLGVMLLGMGALFSWDDAAYWYRNPGQETSLPQESAQAPLGHRVLAMKLDSAESRVGVRQPLLDRDVAALRGQEVTIGAWMWATEPVPVRAPRLRDGSPHVLDLTTTPTFYAHTETVADDAHHVEVLLDPSLGAGAREPVTVYYDGIVLHEGAWPLRAAPHFDDPTGQGGRWGGQPFTNRLRNGSGEWLWPRLRPWVERSLGQYAPAPPSLFVASILDWSRTSPFYWPTADNLFRTFWARFGWNHIGLPEVWYRILKVITTFSLVGGLFRVARAARSSYGVPEHVGAMFNRGSSGPGNLARKKRAIVFLATVILIGWGSSLLRLHPNLDQVFTPSARYGYPVIIPTALALMAGWLAWVPRRHQGRAALGLLGALALLDVVSMTTIWKFFGGM